MFARAKGFDEDLLIVDLAASAGPIAEDDFEPEAEIWNALVLGVRDYARKTGFRKALLGLSGGIDSALTAALAADALGRENVLGVMMPSRYSSPGSVDDSLATGAQPRHRNPRPAHRAHHAALRRRPRRAPSAASRPTSPRRTSSRASAAIS